MGPPGPSGEDGERVKSFFLCCFPLCCYSKLTIVNIIICCLNILLIFDCICFISIIIIIFIKHKKTVVIFLIVLFLLDCCQGDDGDVGPRGLPGEPVGVSVSQTLDTDMTVYMILLACIIWICSPV